VHRIGRTGRAGAQGEAVSLVCVDENEFLRDIEKLIKRSIPREVVPGFEPDPNEKPEPIVLGRRMTIGVGASRGGRPGGPSRGGGQGRSGGHVNHANGSGAGGPRGHGGGGGGAVAVAVVVAGTVAAPRVAVMATPAAVTTVRARPPVAARVPRLRETPAALAAVVECAAS